MNHKIKRTQFVVDDDLIAYVRKSIIKQTNEQDERAEK